MFFITRKYKLINRIVMILQTFLNTNLWTKLQTLFQQKKNVPNNFPNKIFDEYKIFCLDIHIAAKSIRSPMNELC